MDERRACLHESGHALASMLLGYRALYASITNSNPKCSTGSPIRNRILKWTRRGRERIAKEQVQISMAGAAAEDLGGLELQGWRWENDLEDALYEAADVGEDSDFIMAQLKVVREMLERNAADLKALAEELERERLLLGRDIERIMEKGT